MNLSQLEITRVDKNLHRRIYQWSAQQFDPGWVLDVGTELGVGIDVMQSCNPRIDYLGCDTNFKSLRSSKSLAGNFGQVLLQADGEHLPLRAEFLSGVCLINLLHLVDKARTIVDETSRCLKRGGKAVVYVDLSKLPSRWEAEPLRQHLDELLKSHFELMTPNDARPVGFEDLIDGDILSQKAYLRLGQKR